MIHISIDVKVGTQFTSQAHPQTHLFQLASIKIHHLIYILTYYRRIIYRLHVIYMLLFVCNLSDLSGSSF